MMTRPRNGLFAVLASIAVLTACDDRFNPTYAGIRPRGFVVDTGSADLVQVDRVALPHLTSLGGTNYSLVSGTFSLHGDSTWLYSSVEVLSGTNGVIIGSSPANYTGRWTVTDSTINMLTANGFIRIKGDTLFWKGGPRHSWEDSLTFTLRRK